MGKRFCFDPIQKKVHTQAEHRGGFRYPSTRNFAMARAIAGDPSDNLKQVFHALG